MSIELSPPMTSEKGDQAAPKNLPKAKQRQEITVGEVKNSSLVSFAAANESNDSKLVATLIDEFKSNHQRYVSSARDALAHALTCGQSLQAIRALYGHSQWSNGFGRDLQPQLGVSLRTAERYLKIYSEFQAFIATDQNAIDKLRDDSMYPKLIADFKVSRTEETKMLALDPNDWMTPDTVLAAAVGVLGEVDVDPCASSENPPKRLFAPRLAYRANSDADGLSPNSPWSGRCFIAPGHSGDLSAWIAKALHQLEVGAMHAGLLLIPTSVLVANAKLLQFPFAILKEQMEVQTRTWKKKKGAAPQLAWKSRVMSQSFAISLVCTKGDIRTFEQSFRDIAFVFGRVRQREASPSIAPVHAEQPANA